MKYSVRISMKDLRFEIDTNTEDWEDMTEDDINESFLGDGILNYIEEAEYEVTVKPITE